MDSTLAIGGNDIPKSLLRLPEKHVIKQFSVTYKIDLYSLTDQSGFVTHNLWCLIQWSVIRIEYLVQLNSIVGQSFRLHVSVSAIKGFVNLRITKHSNNNATCHLSNYFPSCHNGFCANLFVLHVGFPSIACKTPIFIQKLFFAISVSRIVVIFNVLIKNWQ